MLITNPIYIHGLNPDRDIVAHIVDPVRIQEHGRLQRMKNSWWTMLSPFGASEMYNKIVMTHLERKTPCLKQYALLIHFQCLDDLLNKQLPVQSIPVWIRVIYLKRKEFRNQMYREQYHIKTYLIAASRVLVASGIESVMIEKNYLQN